LPTREADGGGVSVRSSDSLDSLGRSVSDSSESLELSLLDEICRAFFFFALDFAFLRAMSESSSSSSSRLFFLGLADFFSFFLAEESLSLADLFVDSESFFSALPLLFCLSLSSSSFLVFRTGSKKVKEKVEREGVI
jgi:hypothetical protein